MEPWELSKYERPYLVADEIRADVAARSVEVLAFGETYDIDVPDADVAELAECLLELRDPANPQWRRLLTSPDHTDLRELLDMLDGLGLVGSWDSGGTQVAADEENAVREVIGELSRWLTSSAASRSRPAMTASIEAVLSRGRQPWADGLPVVSLDGQPNFPLTTLALQRHYWGRNAFLAQAAVNYLFAQVTGQEDEAASRALADLAGGPEGPDSAIQAVCTAASLVALSASPGASITFTQATKPTSRMSGINLVLEAERTSRAVLERIGPPRYVDALERGEYPDSYMRGVFLEEFYVNRRFVETICPALIRPFRDPLRDRLFRYYNEELGHEELERASCRALGITDAQIDSYLSLPYHASYVNSFVAIGQEYPFGYLSSIMVTEGLPGEPYGMNDLIDVDRFGAEFAKVFREHEKVDDSMRHETLARHLMAAVPSVSPSQCVVALNCVAYLTELTHRAWDLLFDVHAGGPLAMALPPHYGWPD